MWLAFPSGANRPGSGWTKMKWNPAPQGFLGVSWAGRIAATCCLTCRYFADPLYLFRKGRRLSFHKRPGYSVILVMIIRQTPSMHLYQVSDFIAPLILPFGRWRRAGAWALSSARLWGRVDFPSFHYFTMIFPGLPCRRPGAAADASRMAIAVCYTARLPRHASQLTAGAKAWYCS